MQRTLFVFFSLQYNILKQKNSFFLRNMKQEHAYEHGHGHGV